MALYRWFLLAVFCILAGSHAAPAAEVPGTIRLADLKPGKDERLILEITQDLIVPPTFAYTAVSYQDRAPRESIVAAEGGERERVELGGGLDPRKISCRLSFKMTKKAAFVVARGRYEIRRRQGSFPMFRFEPNAAGLHQIDCAPASETLAAIERSARPMDEAVLERMQKRTAAYEAVTVGNLKDALGSVAVHLEKAPQEKPADEAVPTP